LNFTLEERSQELITANQELEAFTYTAAHDLSAPLRHLHGYSSFLKEAWYDRMDNEGRHFLDRIMIASKEMATLLDELLNFSRLIRVEMQTSEVRLSSLVARIRDELQPEANYQRIAWQIEDLPTVEGDQSLLHQALFNLLSNAVKYTRENRGPADHRRIHHGFPRAHSSRLCTRQRLRF
jgi:light-regulated signal transduction histidine kinase (bacteriophytochrome)